jgi:long-subunit acyl-CoA synthetase (AMP-forming)
MYGTTPRTSTSIKDRPAYWARTSRFVPRHLYGQGAEAVRAYRIEQGLSKSPASTRPASTEPLDISSPIPAQLSYNQSQTQPMSYKQEQYKHSAPPSGLQVFNVDAQDENAIITDNEEEIHSYDHFSATSSYPGAQFTSLSQPQHHQQQQEGEEYYDQDADSEMLDGEEEELLDYDEESDLDEEGDEDEEGQDTFDEHSGNDDDEGEEDDDDGGDIDGASDPSGKPGATEDDAIELSD